jgi:GNAT superfamily N-acetyltransferase
MIGGMKLRVARHTEKLEAVAAFYRDRVGFPELGRFVDHDGYDGVFLAVPGTGTQLELTSGGLHRASEPHPESLLVLYLDTQAEIDAIVARIAQRPVVPANPYWREHALAFEDPDGFQLLLTRNEDGRPPLPLRVEEYSGEREELRSLFELAEDSPMQVASYLDEGRVLVAVMDEEVVGHLQLTETGREDEAEIKNMAVVASKRRRGIGRALVAAATRLARDESRSALLVATAAADVDNLRFYQHSGFRMRSIERDAFTAATGYVAETSVDGLELRDRVWLDLNLDPVLQIRRARAAESGALLALWERSVRATHDFLTEPDIVALRPLTKQALADDALDLWVLTERDVPIAFMGLVGNDIAALFFEPARRRQGGGRLLVAHAQQLRGGELTVDVNEHNRAARDFYAALGFRVVGRSPLDDGGRPFPLLHMRRPAVSNASERNAR